MLENSKNMLVAFCGRIYPCAAGCYEVGAELVGHILNGFLMTNKAGVTLERRLTD